MSFLTTLLPGLRDLRAPLAAGYLWLVATWLAFAQRIPTEKSAEGVWNDIYRLGQIAGRPGALAASAFAAYLLGILTERLSLLVVPALVALTGPKSDPVFRSRQIIGEAVIDALFERYQESKEFREASPAHLSRDVLKCYMRKDVLFLEFLSPYLSDEDRKKLVDLGGMESFRRSYWTAPIFDSAISYTLSTSENRLKIMGWAERTEDELRTLLSCLIDTASHVESVMADLSLVPARLVGTPVYERWDRLRAESEFRFSIAPPLMTLSIILALRLSPLCWLLGIPCIYLFYKGIAIQREANAQLAESVRVKQVASPPLERVKSGEPRWQDWHSSSNSGIRDDQSAKQPSHRR